MNLKHNFDEATLCFWKYGDSKTDTEFSIDVKAGKLYIAFMGSTSGLDWLYNFMFWRVPYRGMKKKFRVHAGFLRKYKSIQAELQEIVKENPLPIELRGYSQGAALATLAHEDILYVTGRQPRTIIFASPRVISRKMCERFTNLLNVQHRGDIVTWLPFFCPHVGAVRKVGRFDLFSHRKYLAAL